MGLLKLLKELVQLVESEDKQLTLLNDWESFSNSFADELKNAKSQAFKQLLIGRIKTKDNMKTVADENLKKLLKVWKLTAEASESEPESSTKRLKAWLNNDESPDKLFTVLGIHKAVDEAANKFLISANLERWNYFMELFYDGAGHYNFEDQLKITLQPFCEDDLCMTLFLERLVILRERRNTEHKKWLNEMKEPQELYTLMEVDNEENQFVKKKLAAWITYVDAYNDLYPHRQTTLSACSPYSEEELIKMSFHGETRYPQIGPKRRILADILKSWADAKPPPPFSC
ncbi:hypothetical protein DD238_000363 [Peronospora effusa]|uniref:Uncharacterized protein n=1 Tax=Peronospora effusa TaxID=542832 RepID=A0A3M6VUK5_9STRA|nr:hypothetical protein DD238_000363 [Peronospora effusa]